MFGDVDRESLVRVTERLRHRGPDGIGVTLDDHGGLGHTRLSLIDFEGGAQPVRSPRSGRLLAYNGELYNHDALRRELIDRGCALTTRCDTEVVLAAFDVWGERCVERFDGMYAFAILERDRLVVARDRFGIKPVFWTVSPDRRRALFASEVGALLADPGVSCALDRTAVLEAQVLGYPLDHKTLFRAIERVPPGAMLEVRLGDGDRIETRTLHHARPVQTSPAEQPDAPDVRDAPDVIDRCEAALAEQVRLQCIADHPVGVLLSGGLDSSVIAALAARHTPRLYTFTLGTQADDEFAIAAEVARALGSEHDGRLVEFDECLRRLPATIATLAWPTSFSLVESATARMRQSVKAVLCGDGADELLGGYLAHGAPGRWLGFMSQRLGHATAVDWGADPTRITGVLRALTDTPVLEQRNRVYQLFLDNQLGISHLERWDHLSMADGLEVRVPFLCNALAELPAALRWPALIDATGGKRILKQVARRVLPEPVRDLVVNRRKRPFWESTGGLYAQFQAFVRSIQPDDLRRSHPFRQAFDSPESQLVFDVFVLIFAGHRGAIPEGFEVRELYQDRWGLRDLLATAAA
jgi:asparagine synthase (glutamine-hydrolysing)